MADPLSIVASSISVLSLCMQAYQNAFNLVEAVKFPEKTHEELLHVLGDLRVVLATSEGAFSTQQPYTSVAFNRVSRILYDVNQELTNLMPKLKKERGASRLRRVLFENRSLDVNIRRLRDLVSTLRTSVEAIGATAQMSDLVETIERQRNELANLLSLQQTKLVKSDTSLSLENIQTVEAKDAADASNDDSVEIIEQLSQVDYESKHYFHASQRPMGSSRWFLDDSEYERWLKSTRTIGSKNFLWLNGLAGSGKTTITSLVIDELLNQFRSEPTVAVAFFYFEYKTSITIQQVIMTVLKQFCLCLPRPYVLPEEVSNVYRLKCLGRTPTLSSLIDTLSKVCERFHRTILVLDGLDEFDGEGLLSFLGMLKDTPCKVFAASRPTAPFASFFSASPVVYTKVDSGDIITYTAQTIQNNPGIQELLDAPLMEEINQRFLEYSENTFLLPVLQMQYLLEQTSTWEIRQYLKNAPQSLEALYKRTVDRILLQSEPRSNLARKVLTWVAYAKRPITLVELQHALSVSPGDPIVNKEKFTTKRIIEKACFNLVSVDSRSSIVVLSHFSFQNYLEMNRDELFHHTNVLADACLDYLLMDEFRNGPCRTEHALDERLRNYPFAKYAAVYWGDHQPYLVTQFGSQVKQFLNSPLALMAATQIYFAEQQVLLFDQDELRKFSPLHWTASFGLIGELDKLLTSSSVAVNSQDPLERTPLHWAIEKKQGEAAGLLLKHGSRPSIVDRTGANALHLAVRDVSNTCLAKVLKVGEASLFLQRDSNDQTPLQIASVLGSNSAVMMILDRMSTMSATEQVKRDALGDAISNGRADVVDILLENIDPDPQELLKAARFGSEDVVRVLFEHGVDLSIADDNGLTAIHEASRAGKIDMIHFLLNNGVDINASDKSGCTPLHFAVGRSNRVVAELLLREGADPNATTRSRSTIFDLAVAINDTEMATLLHSYGGHLSENPPANSLALAIKSGNESMVRLLLDIDAPNFFAPGTPQTLLHEAVDIDHAGIIQLLLQAGANIDAQDANGCTPLATAIKKQNKSAELLLLKNGASPPDEEEIVHASSVEKLPPKIQRSDTTAFQDYKGLKGARRSRLLTFEKAVQAVDLLEIEPLIRESSLNSDLDDCLSIGIHFETNILQASFGTRDLNDIQMLEWDIPRGRPHATFMPTLISYPDENPRDSAGLKWGYQVFSSMVSHSGSTFLLDPKKRGHLKQDKKSHRMSTEVCTDFLRLLYEYIDSYLAERVAPVVLERPFQYCFTVSASWSPEMTYSLKKVIEQAGFSRRSKDRIMLVPDVEAAALVVLTQLDAKNAEPINTGECFIICHCGNATVECATYTLTARTPNLQFSESSPGEGADCGFDAVREAFEQWMEVTFGNAFLSLPMSKRGPNSKFAREAELLKHAIQKHDASPVLIDLPMECSNHEYYDEDEQYVKLDRSTLMNFFRPSVEGIMELIQTQVRYAAVYQKRRSRNIFLTGTFASCEYLYEQIEKYCRYHEMHLLVPPKSAEAAAIGACLNAVNSQSARDAVGSHPMKAKVITSRISSHHYGIATAVPFKDGDDQSLRFYDKITDQAMSKKIIWLVSKGDKLQDENTASMSMRAFWDRERGNSAQGQIQVYSSASDHEPSSYTHDPSVSHVATFFYEVQPKEGTGAERSSISRKYGSMKRKPLNVDVRLEIGKPNIDVSVTCDQGSVFTKREF